MVLLGTLLLLLALMKRVPLSFEVGGAKFDASYPPDKAYDAGREGGVREGLQQALRELEDARLDDQRAADVMQRLQIAQEHHRLRLPDDADQPTLPFDFELETTDTGELGYDSPTVCSAAAIAYRQLDYWTRTGLLDASIRKGSLTAEALYSRKDILLARTTKSLLDTGISLREIRTVLTQLRSRTEHYLPRITLMSDGTSTFECTTDAEILDLVSSGQAVFGISLAGVASEVDAALTALPPPHR